MPTGALTFKEVNLEDLKIPLNCSVSPSTGSATIQVGVPLTPGRNGIQPSLSLSYSSGAPNSVFGMGWNLQGIPSIGLSLKDGYPKYNGNDQYAFGGQELVPMLDESLHHRLEENDAYWIYYYRTTTDSSFSRFEKWINKENRITHWRIHNPNNQVMVFGQAEDNTTKIYDPQHPENVFQWLLEAQYDGLGNAIKYEYLPDNQANIDGSTSFERNRLYGGFINAQKYVKRILYGNTVAAFPEGGLDSSQQFLFEVIFDYGEHAGDVHPSYAPSPEWQVRQDPFSSYIAGFELRTYRLCKRILMFHHFEELGDGPTLIGNLELTHQQNPAGTTLTEIHYTAYQRVNRGSTYTTKSLPPAVFSYTSPEVERTFRPAPEHSQDNVPIGLHGINYKWIDLYGEGLPGVLYEANECWYYKPNLGGGRSGKQQKVAEKPSSAFGSYALSDFDGDGNLNIVVLQGKESGYYEYKRDEGVWDSYRPFKAAPHVRPMDTYTQLLDLTGDGLADIVTVEEDRIVWYPSKGKEGFDKPVQIAKPVSNGQSRTPAIGANPMLDYFFADMNGSGLPDQVRVLNGRVEYWPNLGNGKFGAGIVMEDAPQLDFDFELDASRIRLVDLDGSGTADLMYIGRGEIRYWINASGNQFLSGVTLRGLPFIDNISSAQVIDFLGDGTPCLLWSSALSINADAPIHYLRLTNGVKPRLMLNVQNSMGQEHSFHYGYSGQHYLRDKASDTPWISKLPSHHTVVDRLEIIDLIGHTRVQQLFQYHDGFFDGEERTFRGFCHVDQYDSDVYQRTSSIPREEFTDPVCVRTWFHNGAPGWQHSRAQRYYQEDDYSWQLKDFEIENAGALGAEEFFQAIRSLSGQTIRSEVYGLNSDGSRNAHPFQVTHTSFLIRRLQAKHEENDPVFAVFQRENLNIIYEEKPEDPRITHNFTLNVDYFGVPTLQAAVAYPRLAPGAFTEQEVLHVHAAQLDVLHFNQRDRYEAGIELERKSFEVRGIESPASGRLLTFESLSSNIERAIETPLAFDAPFEAEPQARLLQWSKNYYWNDAQSAALPWREVGGKPLLHHVEAACFHDDFLINSLGEHYEASLSTEGYYVLHEALWWQPGAVLHYLDSSEFYLPAREVQVNGARSEYNYDDYHLLLSGITAVLVDESGAELARNTTTAQPDYHVLAPYQIVDANGNTSEVHYDPLGVVILSSSYGEILSEEDRIERYGHERLEAYVDPAEEVSFERILANPQAYIQGCASYLYYELDTWQSTMEGLPLRSLALAREDWVHDGSGNPNQAGNIQLSINYRNGFGQTIQSKTLVEPGGDTIQYEGGRVVTGPDGEPVLIASTGSRWRVSGHTVFNNKQLPVRQYEPYFSPLHTFESDEVLETFGQAGRIDYDALGRQKNVLNADGTRSSVSITPWQTSQFDANDAVEGSPYELRITASNGIGTDTPEMEALEKSKAHYNTPVVTHLDALGRAFLTEENNEARQTRRIRTLLDALGNPLQVIDPRGLPAFSYTRDMQGRVFREQSVDAGPKWQFINALDQAVHLWIGRNVHQQFGYDTWGRIKEKRADGALGMLHLTERFVYGEDTGIRQAAERNLYGQLVEHYDQAGIMRIQRYDIMGNVLEKERHLLEDYKSIPDWDETDSFAWVEGAPFTTSMAYDALGRPREEQVPDGTIRRYSYLQSGAVGQVLVTTADGLLTDVPVLRSAAYNARGQQTQLELGNRVMQHYEYDPHSFRLSRKRSFRSASNELPTRQYQNIRYTYDAVGNITHLIDTAQPNATSLFAAPRINRYTYDAFYQLTRAEGRTHQALQSLDYAHAPDAPGFVKGTRHITLANMDLLQTYTRQYTYDLGGNMQNMIHHAGTRPGEHYRWRRDYWIAANSNRSLPATNLLGNPISNPETRFDGNGNCLYLPHLNSFEWNYLNQLSHAMIIEREAGPNDAEYYVYGGDGQRVRKVSEHLRNGSIEYIEKIYLDGCEIKRIRRGSILSDPILERYTSHLSDGSDRIALLHQWTRDTRSMETDNLSNKKIHYQLTDHLGSSTFELDEQGEVINYEEYFPFGGSAFLYGEDIKDVRVKDYRYSGKEQDDVTKLYYYGFRYYAPWLGRWLSPDPIGPQDGLNVYQFVHNNPVSNYDIKGLQATRYGAVVPVPDMPPPSVPEPPDSRPYGVFNEQTNEFSWYETESQQIAYLRSIGGGRLYFGRVDLTNVINNGRILANDTDLSDLSSLIGRGSGEYSEEIVSDSERSTSPSQYESESADSRGESVVRRSSRTERGGEGRRDTDSSARFGDSSMPRWDEQPGVYEMTGFGRVELTGGLRDFEDEPGDLVAGDIIVARARHDRDIADREHRAFHGALSRTVIEGLPDLFTGGIYSDVISRIPDLKNAYSHLEQGEYGEALHALDDAFRISPMAKRRAIERTMEGAIQQARDIYTNLHSENPKVRGEAEGQVTAFGLNILFGGALGRGISGPGISFGGGSGTRGRGRGRGRTSDSVTIEGTSVPRYGTPQNELPKFWKWTAYLDTAVRMEGFQIYLADRIEMPRAVGLQPRNWPGGFLRSGPYYFERLLEAHPEFFSPSNLELMQDNLAPIVDQQWVQHHPGHSRFLGQVLDHHHLGRGQVAVAIPRGAHTGPGAYKLNHY